MASRTKSFFDQDHRPKSGNRGKPNQRRAALNEFHHNVVPPKPPIPANTQTKTKLQAFQFVPTNDENDLAQEQSTAQQGSRGEAMKDAGTNKPAALKNDTATTTESPAKHPASGTGSSAANNPAPPSMPRSHPLPPSTPGTHISLEDLIGNSDDIIKPPPPPEESPEDQIGWIPNSSSTQISPSRKRKRAQSSSPSCPHTLSQRKPVEPPCTAEKAVPEDPTTALWKSYATNKSPSDQKAPDMSHLLFLASPNPLETPNKTPGLRRWASTGNDWPTSRTKRRRTDEPISNSAWRDQTGAKSSGKSKVATMVERLQESLATQRLAQSATKPATAPEVPSSSSPLPETGTGDLVVAGAPSPLQAKRAAAKQPPGSVAPLAKLLQNRPQQSTMTMLSESRPPTTCQDTVAPAPLHLNSKAPLPAFKRPTITRVPSGSGRQYPMTQIVVAPAQAATAAAAEFDEFGDDFDFTMEDLDELESKPSSKRSTLQSAFQQTTTTHQPPPTKSVASKPTVVLDDDDEFGGIDLDEESLVQVEMSATQNLAITPRKRSGKNPHTPRNDKPQDHNASDNHRSHFHRYKVKQIVEGQYNNDRGRSSAERVLMAENEKTQKVIAITLRDTWSRTTVFVGNIIHVTHLPGSNSPSHACDPVGQMVVNDGEGSPFLIVHPDQMLSATTVADSFDCLRKAVLQDRIKATGETNKAMVYGKILHAIFQQALLANQWDEEFLVDLVRRTVENHLEGLWELGMTDTVLASEEVRAKMGEMAAWAKVFVASGPSTSAVVDDEQEEKVWMSVSKLIAIEEHIWSPRYGLKGNVDATIQSTLIDDPRKPSKNLITPFEVKTGRTTNSPAHKAQTALYTLLLSDRYDVSTEAGILYYLESSSMSRILPPLVELRQMIQQRNRLATFLFRAKHPDQSTDIIPSSSQPIEESGLPQMLKNPFKCGRCYAQQSCLSYTGLTENGNTDSAGMIDDKNKAHSQIWQEALGHLALSAKNQSQATRLKGWFTKWDRLLTFEEGDVVKLKNELWTMSSAEREKVGRCFGSLILTNDLSSTSTVVTSTTVDGIEGSGGKINRFAYKFARSRRAGGTFAEGTQLTIGEPVVVSSEQGQWALANGYVVAASKIDITVAVDRVLGDARQRLQGFDAAQNQAFRGVMTVGEEDGQDNLNDAPVLYRLDKDEFSNGLALVRNNLVTLMSSHPIHTRLRELVIQGAKPAFKHDRNDPALAPSQIGQMNEDQMGAVAKVLAAEDYALILGMPGTGKTSTIAHTIGNLLAQGKSILLTSFTHTAVDNILLKIKDIVPHKSILRLGVPAKINPEVQKFCQLAATPRTSIEEIERVYMGSKIVATTCMGINHAIFNRRAFDVCIVDEASQITLPISIGPLLHARKFVLVGDHFQLPPLVQNRKALEGGLDVSLFRQLSEEHPESVATLGKQYRMCEDIMTLSNNLVYSGRLRCGSESVANRTLQVSHPDGLEMYHTRTGDPGACTGQHCWLKEVTRSERKVIFANIDGLGDVALETLTSGKNITNTIEATLCAQAVLGLLALGVPSHEIGVITLYRSQLALIRQLFKAAGISREVEIDSADRFQGRDKECILLSMVRSNRLGIVGDLLKDYRRVNVALTRARSKMIVLGSASTLMNNDLLAQFLKLVDERQWCLNLPKAADSCHAFDFSTQSTASLVPVQEEPSPMKVGRDVVKEGVAASPAHGQTSVLRPSQTGGNVARIKKMKSPAKKVNGKVGAKSRMVMEQIALEFFDELTTEDF